MDRLVEILAPWLPENKVMTGLDALGLASALYAAVVLYRKQQRNPMRLPYPPGPKPRFLVGNIPDMPESKEWLTFTEWGKTYGPLTMIDIMGRKFCILNTAKAASDLLDARSAIYSDRPPMPMVNDLMGWSFNMGLSPYDAKYVKKRKLFHHGFNARTSETYLPIQTREITLSLGKLLATPDQFDDVLRASIGAMLMKIAFGYNTTENDEFIRIAEEAQLAMVKAARMGQYLVDFFPILKHVPEWMPGADFQRVGREGLELANELLEKPFDWAKKQLDEGKAEPSFFTALMDGKGKWTEDPKEEQKMIRDATALMYATGADTILSSFLTFVLAMVHHPEVVRKAQEEVSRVIGSDRLPTLSDRASLPYIDAIVKETYRWESVIPLGVPHRLMKDDVYDGFFLPEGTTMIANQWGISHDEEMYPDAMSFKPERFIGVADSKAGGPRDPNTIAFGWGRRICPGRFLAENHLFIQIAAIFACFNIEPVIGADGKPVIPPRDYTNGLASRPEAFPCKITPRSEAAVELIRQSIAALED